jgi:hypothetical protein
MPVTVVLDYPKRHSARWLQRWIATTAGALMVFVGAVASLVMFPSLLYLVVLYVAMPIVEGGAGEGVPPLDGDILLAAVISTTTTILGLKVGLRLLRGQRRLVLFLRRFGYGEATKAATFAATKTIGRSWRLVTPDDASVAPLGVPTGMKRLVVGSALVRERLMVAPMFVAYVGMYTVAAPCAILVLAFLQAVILDLDRGPFFEPYGRVFESVMEGHIPFDAIQSNLVGAFAIAATLTMFTVWAMIASAAGLLAAVVLSVPFSMLDYASDAVQGADKMTTRMVENATEIDDVAGKIAAESRKIFAPRLVVLRVASEVWQPTVMRLASAGSLTIIDVSEPTENLLWEIQSLTERSGPRCVFVGQSNRVAGLTGSSMNGRPPGSLEGRLLGLLDGREVLAYETGRRGMRRFARALRAKLLEF